MNIIKLKKYFLLAISAFAYNSHSYADISVWDGYSYSLDWYANGSNKTYHIKTAEDLAGLSRCFSMGYYLYGKFEGCTIILDNDINLNGHEWTPIGFSNENHIYTEFAGTFDGNNHTIKGLSITKYKNTGIGLFGSNYVSSFSVKNLKIEGTITLTDFTNVINGEDINIGGIVGYTTGTIDNCQSNINIRIDATSPTSQFVHVNCGSLVGRVEMSDKKEICKNCYTKGNISVDLNNSNDSNIGGIIGCINSNASFLTSVGTECNISVSNGRMSHIGGIVGLAQNSESISNAFFNGKINLDNSNYSICGGIVGGILTDLSIYSCLATGQISKKDKTGWSSSAISGTKSFNGNPVSVYNCYYFSGLSNETSYGIPLSDAELKNGIPLDGFETSIWNFKQGEYPSLKFLNPTTYTLTISASGNGYASYNGTSARNQTRTFTVNEGTSATISFTPDNGYRIGSVLVNNTNVTSSVYNNQYTINNIKANTTVSVTFEQIPQTTYTLSVTASGNGSATYNGTSARNQTRSFTVNQGTSATISFSPDNGYRIGSLLVNNTNVTSSVYNNQYTIGNITANKTVSVTFEQSITSLTYDGVKYRVISFDNKTVNMANGSYAQSITIPASFYSQGFTWTVVGIDNNALSNSPYLSAIIWNPNTSFTSSVSNPNLLLYVKSSQYAPSAIKNVIVNNIASRITLTDAADNNDFYCPQEFTAQNISYTHTYGMTTGIDYAMGWESLALPFDVKNITHSSKGSLLPFAKWSSQANAKPFWLYELKASGFVAATDIKANTPYIISMPNNSQYDSNYNVNGTITFSSSNVVVKKSDNLNTGISGSKYFVPNFSNRASNVGFYALNVKNNYEQNNSSFRDGSIFVKNLRKIHPFEAYIWMSGNNAKESIPIFEDETTPIWLPEIPMNEKTPEKVYNLNGQQVNSNEFRLPKGIYVIKGKKIVIK